jgi:hypothetical protein
VTESGPPPELLSSLGRLVRGLSALFWGLPLALVVCVQTAKSDLLRPLGPIPPLLATIFIYFGLTLLAYFQQQERVWIAALERTKTVAMINVGLSPFLYFWNKLPAIPYFEHVVQLMTLSGLLFLFILNHGLLRLALMLPDETLRTETKVFTSINRYLLAASLIVLATYFIAAEFFPVQFEHVIELLLRLNPFSSKSGPLTVSLELGGIWLMLLFILPPVAMTMALIWKIKEVILSSVFGET